MSCKHNKNHKGWLWLRKHLRALAMSSTGSGECPRDSWPIAETNREFSTYFSLHACSKQQVSPPPSSHKGLYVRDSLHCTVVTLYIFLIHSFPSIPRQLFKTLFSSLNFQLHLPYRHSHFTFHWENERNQEKTSQVLPPI